MVMVLAILSAISIPKPRSGLAGPNITTQWDTVLTESVYTEVGEIVSYGDFNNDGYDDIVGSSPGYGWDRGISRIWLGGYNFNGTLDLVIPSPTADLQRFGFARATGDFNNDGYCDIAISQPYDVGGILLTPLAGYMFLPVIPNSYRIQHTPMTITLSLSQLTVYGR